MDLPIRAMRVITDPIVDLVTVILGLFVFPWLYWSMRVALNLVLVLAGRKISADDLIKWTVIEIFSTKEVALIFLSLQTSKIAVVWESILAALQTSSPSATIPLTQRLEDFFESDSVIARFLEPYFAALGREVRSVTERLHTSWVNIAMGQGTREKIFAIILGYGVFGVLLAVYLNVFTVGNARSAGRAIRSAVRQQLLVVKVLGVSLIASFSHTYFSQVAMFIIIELVVFPLGCGIMLDICTVWVFPEASIESRAAFFTQAPLTAMFYHWVAGTMFM